MLALTLDGKEASEVKEIAKVLKSIKQTGSPAPGVGGASKDDIEDAVEDGISPLEDKIKDMERKLDYTLMRFGKEAILNPSQFEVRRVMDEISKGGYFQGLETKAARIGKAFGKSDVSHWITQMGGQLDPSKNIYEQAGEIMKDIILSVEQFGTPAKQASIYNKLQALRQNPTMANLRAISSGGIKEPVLTRALMGGVQGRHVGATGSILEDNPVRYGYSVSHPDTLKWLGSIKDKIVDLSPDQIREIMDFTGTKDEAGDIIDALIGKGEYLPMLTWSKEFGQAYGERLRTDEQQYLGLRKPDWLLSQVSPELMSEIEDATSSMDIASALKDEFPQFPASSRLWLAQRMFEASKTQRFYGIYQEEFKRKLDKASKGSGEAEKGAVFGGVSNINEVPIGSVQRIGLDTPTNREVVREIANIAQFYNQIKDTIADALDELGEDGDETRDLMERIYQELKSFASKPQQMGGGANQP